MAGYLGDSFQLADICTSALRTAAGNTSKLVPNIDALIAEGNTLRGSESVTPSLLGRCELEVQNEIRLATAVAVGAPLANLVGPKAGFAAAAADVGTTFIAAFRMVAKIGALFGKDVRDPANFAYLAGVLTAGVSGEYADGLAGVFADKRRETLKAALVLGVRYPLGPLVDRLWTPAGLNGNRAVEALVTRAGRICGQKISERGWARAIPIAGAIFNGGCAYSLMTEVATAAKCIAAEDALAAKFGAD